MIIMTIIIIVVERVTCHVSIPKGHNPRKQGWREVVSNNDVIVTM